MWTLRPSNIIAQIGQFCVVGRVEREPLERPGRSRGVDGIEAWGVELDEGPDVL